MNQNENNLVEIQPSLNPIEYSIDRLGDIKSKTWWKHLTTQEEAVILSLFNRIATLSNNLEEKKAPHLNSVLNNFLEMLNNWITQSVSSIKELDITKISKQIDTQHSRFEKKIDKDQLAKPAEKVNKTKVSDSSSLISKKLTSIESKLENIIKLNTDHYDFSKKTSDDDELTFEVLTNSIKLISTAIESQSKLINNMINKSDISNIEDFQFLSKNLVNLMGQYEDLKNELKDELSKRIHIRDSIQVLEIREDVEKFVASDLIKKISLEVIPALEALKEASSEDVPKAVQELESRCMRAGLIPLERLFS